MLKTIIISLLVVGALSQAPVTSAAASNETAEGVKNQTAAGRHYGGHGWGNPWGHHWGPSFDPPIVDDYICDLDATILVVTNNDNRDDNNDGRYKRENRPGNNDERYGNGRDDGYGNGRDDGYGNGRGRDNDRPNADRLKCSVIASDDNHSCSSCCRLAARRDRSIAQHDIVGFIVDNDQIDRDQQDDDNDRNGPYRAKRDAPASPPGTEPRNNPENFRDDGHHVPRNPLCVCCAPRKFGFPHFRPFHHRHHRGGY